MKQDVDCERYKRLRRLGGCHRCAAAKDVMRKLVAMEKILREKQERS